MWDLIVSVPDHCLSFYFTPEKVRKASLNLSVKGFFSDVFLESTLHTEHCVTSISTLAMLVKS